MRALLTLLAVASAACQSAAPRPAPLAAAMPVLTERWLTPPVRYRNIDSLAVWRPTSDAWLVATEKTGDVLLAYDLRTGAFVCALSGRGSAPGRLQRPNGIAIAGDLAFVVERDNRRLQVLQLPEGRPLGSFGGGDLAKPYGIALVDRGEGRFAVYVTDNDETLRNGVTPPEVFARRVHQYDVTIRDGAVAATRVRAFGDREGTGRLFVVETIAVDPDNDQLLVADETTRDVKIYTLEGRFTGRAAGEGVFRMQPEGIVMAGCDVPRYWIMTDQDPVRNVFHVFERGSLRHLGAFEGKVARGTDGVAFAPVGTSGLATGALLAMHDDAQVAAYGWDDIQHALSLARCD